MAYTERANIGDIIRITNAKPVGRETYENGDTFTVLAVDGVVAKTDAYNDNGTPLTVRHEEYELLPQSPPKDYAEVTQAERLSDIYPKYYKDVRGIDEIDVYKTHELFGIDDPSGAIHHASKKLLLSGARTGGKSKYDDVREARDTLTRWLDMHPGVEREKAKEAE